MVDSFYNYIEGQWASSTTDRWTKVINPANTDDVLGNVPASSSKDAEKAILAAKKAKTEWKKMSGPSRGEYLYKAAEVLDANKEDIARTMTREMGKTFPEALGETNRGVAILRYYAGEGMRKTGDVIPSSDKDALMHTIRAPLGVVGVITPWNFPVAIPIWKMAPALIYGNTVVIKPANGACITAIKIFKCLEEAGFPEGVINLVSGSGSEVGNAITTNEEVAGITFTGSDTVGKQIGQEALKRGIKYQLEMGGKNPVIVTKSADLDLAATATVSGGLKSTGQKCTATSRVIVEKDVYEEFKEKLLQKVSEINVGDGLEETTWMGPCASESQLDNVLSYIEKGVKEGAELVAGGSRLTQGSFAKGYYVEPTVFDNVTTDMAIAQEEIFGPVLALIKADNFEESIELANNVEFGLSASVFTKDIQQMLDFMDDIEAGLVRVNAESAGVELQAPFGGMKKSSSHSREQGEAAKEFFTSIKTVFVKG
ncbi:alpha-ketoglutaric semialdehyde dehydrogenase GucD [Salibacterium aidingense]|uniref:alpha-ketoglutaric semialdehyde dehydrogenase GucD n=1 Tax=Salibacterium aidingense TaxID=384933 RepID=UPI000402EB4E|nr:alpha-ketoglutaric semialdehyde dehydrogenase GucD [Salibacterium aidingense]